jgi:succinate dehydrogenase/fumarate reductase cytochrome b subunit
MRDTELFIAVFFMAVAVISIVLFIVTGQEEDKKYNKATEADAQKARKKEDRTGLYIFWAIFGLVALYFMTFGYGYWKAKSMHENGRLSVMTAGMVAVTMNPVSAKGFGYYLRNNTNMRERTNKLSRDLDELERQLDNLRGY